MKVVYRILPLIAPAVAVCASVALGEPNASAFSYAASGACLASPEGFNSKLEPNNSGVAWTTIFTSSVVPILTATLPRLVRGSIFIFRVLMYAYARRVRVSDQLFIEFQIFG